MGVFSATRAGCFYDPFDQAGRPISDQGLGGRTPRIAVFASDCQELPNRFDGAAGLFCAYGSDRAVLDHLGRLISVRATNPAALRELVHSAEPEDFDD